MDITNLLPQLGVGAIFALAAYKLYNDQRADSIRREEKLLDHLDKVSDTLEKINERLMVVEKNVCYKKDVSE